MRLEKIYDKYIRQKRDWSVNPGAFYGLYIQKRGWVPCRMYVPMEAQIGISITRIRGMKIRRVKRHVAKKIQEWDLCT